MYNVVELFSGIGSQAKALKNLGCNINLVGTSEWDVHAIIAYDLIQNNEEMPQEIADMSKAELLEKLSKYTFSNTGKAPLEFRSLRTYSKEVLQHLYLSITRNKNYVDISTVQGKALPRNIDIMTYSFPCQDLSNVGAFHGYTKGIDKDSGSRSSLLWQVGRILTEMNECGKKLPRFLLMENVPTLLSERHLGNFTTWICDLKKLGYVSKYYQLNASDFGLPQNRPRLLMISVWVGNNERENELVVDYFKGKKEADVISDYKSSQYFKQQKVQDLLRTNYSNPKIFDEAVEATPNDTVSRKKIWEENPQIILPGNRYNESIQVIRTITTKQDRNPNSGNLYFDSGIAGRANFRYLTPRECLLFMGFTDSDYRQLKNHNMEFHKGDALFARDKIIRMAGNSIPVKLLEGVFLQILQIDALLSEFRKRAFVLKNDYSEKETYCKEIRSYLFSKGIRCRKPGGQYPESPDIVYPKYKTAVFLYDCFLHGHNCVNSELPEINREFWKNKIAASKESDRKKHLELQANGWNVLVVWQCQMSQNLKKDTLRNIEKRIRNARPIRNEKVD